MGCAASTNTAIVTPRNAKSGKVPIAAKKPLPPISSASENGDTSGPTSRSKVEPLPALPLRTGKFTNNVAFEITMGEDAPEEPVVKRVLPRRLKRLQPIQPQVLTSEQLEEKQRAAEAKRDRIKQNIRLKSARSAKPRSVRIQELLEEAEARQKQMEFMTAEQADQLINADMPPVSRYPQSRVPRQSITSPRTGDLADAEISSGNPLGNVNTSPYRTHRIQSTMASGIMSTDVPAESSYPSPYKKDSVNPLSLVGATDEVKINSISQDAAVRAAAKHDEDQLVDVDQAFSSRRNMTDQLNVAIPTELVAVRTATPQLERLTSVLDDDVTDFGVNDQKPNKLGITELGSRGVRTGSAESGFISAVHSAEASGKKPLSDSEIIAFSKQQAAKQPAVDVDPLVAANADSGVNVADQIGDILMARNLSMEQTVRVPVKHEDDAF